MMKKLSLFLIVLFWACSLNAAVNPVVRGDGTRTAKSFFDGLDANFNALRDSKADKENTAFVAGSLNDIKILTPAEPVNGEPLITATPSDKTKQTYTASKIDSLGVGGGAAFVLDTFPTYEDSPHTGSGIAVNGTSLAIWSATANKWLTVSLTDSLNPASVGPTVSNFAYDSTGLILSFTGSKAANVDCAKLSATFTAAGVISNYSSNTGNGTTSFTCSSTTPVYSGDSGTIASSAGLLIDLDGMQSSAFSGIPVDNALNTASGVAKVSVSDNFDDYSNLASIDTTGKWTHPNVPDSTFADARSVTDKIVGTSSRGSIAYWSADTFSVDQKSCMEVLTIGSGGPGVRISSSPGKTGYYMTISTGNHTLSTISGGLATYSAASVNDVVCLSAVGSSPVVLTVSINGVQQTPYNDNTSAYTSGQPGVVLYNNTYYGDNWTGEDL